MALLYDKQENYMKMFAIVKDEEIVSAAMLSELQAWGEYYCTDTDRPDDEHSELFIRRKISEGFECREVLVSVI